ncbi:MAG: class I SAM-dependent methyltransferase [Acidimicrobiia bacterium]
MDAEDWDRRYADRPWLWTAEPNLFLVTEVGEMAPGRALDLACGEGRNAVWLAERGWTVTAVDFSAVATARARELAELRGVEVDVIRHDLLTYEPAPLAYDLVSVMYLHLVAAERAGVLRSAVEAVAPGGTVLVVGHDLENLEHGHGGPQVPEVLYTAEAVAAELAPLAIVRAGQVTRAVETDDGIVTAVDALVRAERPAVD